MIKVARVLPDTVASELGILPGTVLQSVNGRELEDFLDWEFLTADDELVIEGPTPAGRGGRVRDRASRGRGDGDRARAAHACAAVPTAASSASSRGSPRGLRKPLYVRDDDYRLSFAYGNFATLSNVKERDIARILEYRLSPLYVSVHATPWEARKVLLNNPRVPNILEAAHAARRGRHPVPLPDGDRAGAQRRRRARAVASRPVVARRRRVVRRDRTGGTHAVLASVHGRLDERRPRERAARRTSSGGRRARCASAAIAWVFGSDELYLLAGASSRVPSTTATSCRSRTASAPSPSLRKRVAEGCALAAAPRRAPHRRRHRRVDGGRLMPSCSPRSTAATGAHFELIVAENSLFGPTTTAAGLLVGADIRRALSGRTDLDLALIPAETINDDGLFLDDERFVIAARGDADAGRIHRTTFIDVLSNEDRATPCRSSSLRASHDGHRTFPSWPSSAARTSASRRSSTASSDSDTAIVSEEAGTTRDRHFARAEWNGRAFWLVDTGGLTDDPSIPMDVEIRKQVMQAIDEADLLLLVVDAKAGLHPQRPARGRAAARLAASRGCSSPTRWTTRAPRTSTSSTSSARAIRFRCRRSTARTRATCSTRSCRAFRPPLDEDESSLRVAVIGRPNVGKSSLVNRLLGEERLVVAEEAGTTRDAIDTPMHVPRADADLRGHGRAAPPVEDRRRHRVLFVAAHAARDRARATSAC